MIDFDATDDDVLVINQIARRAPRELGYAVLSADMDVTACHLNGCPLRLRELLDAGAGDFGHDMSGIRFHIDRATGELGDCFVPRLAE